MFRLLILLILLPLSAIRAADSSDQQTDYSFTFEGISLHEALSTLARQTDLDLSFDPGIIPDTEINRSFESESSTRILFDLIRPYRLNSYMLPNGVFLINRSLRTEPARTPDFQFTPLTYPQMQGSIRSTDTSTGYKVRSIGKEKQVLSTGENEELYLSGVSRQNIIFITGKSIVPYRISPEKLYEGFELRLQVMQPRHPYVAVE